MRHAEIVLEPAFGVGALFVAEDADALAAETAEAADDGVIVAELAVARQRREIADQAIDIVEAMRPLRMARDLGLLPRRQGRHRARLQRQGRLCTSSRLISRR